jgi:hypothetical protein
VFSHSNFKKFKFVLLDGCRAFHASELTIIGSFVSITGSSNELFKATEENWLLGSIVHLLYKMVTGFIGGSISETEQLESK